MLKKVEEAESRFRQSNEPITNKKSHVMQSLK